MRPVERYRSEVVTCSQCGQRSPKYLATLLDEKPWCHGCYDELEYGDKRRACATRGFHEWASSISSGHVGHVRCACGNQRPWDWRAGSEPQTWPYEKADGR